MLCTRNLVVTKIAKAQENAIQDTATSQPEIASNGTLLADGISFDGTNDSLTTSGVFAVNTSASIFAKIKH